MAINIEHVKEFLGSDFESYRQTLASALQTDEQYLQVINNYVLGSRGKEIRPVLSLLAGRACGKISEKNYCVAAATEMLHTATLMHDDVADGAYMRRGALSVASMFSIPAAVLTGDFWLARTMSLLVSTCPPEALLFFSDAIKQMSEGELLQLDKAGRLDTTEEDYLKIIYGKTAALFVAALKSAALVSGAGAAASGTIASYARNVGLAFQIRDDILDYLPGLNTGKQPGADLKERKITLPLICALRNAPREAPQIISKIGKIESLFGRKTTPQEDQIISEVSDFVLSNKGIEGATGKLKDYTKAAVDSLSLLPSSDEKAMLSDFAEFVGMRGR